jgi:glutaredoxin
MEAILKRHNIQYRVLSVDEDEVSKSFLANVVKREPPVLFVAGDPIGGLAELEALDASGDLVRRVFG